LEFCAIITVAFDPVDDIHQTNSYLIHDLTEFFQLCAGILYKAYYEVVRFEVFTAVKVIEELPE
jgi:hypothetical protein